MDLRHQIMAATKEAMRAQNAVHLAALRLVNAAIKDRDIAAHSEDRCNGIEDEEILALLTKLIRQREDSAHIYEENGRPELAERERVEIDVIRQFMPKPLLDAEVEQIVQAIIAEHKATCLKDMGKIMGQLKRDYMGRIDMSKVGNLVKARLGGEI